MHSAGLGGPNFKKLFRFLKTHRISLPFASRVVLKQTLTSKKCLFFATNGKMYNFPDFRPFWGGQDPINPPPTIRS